MKKLVLLLILVLFGCSKEVECSIENAYQKYLETGSYEYMPDDDIKLDGSGYYHIHDNGDKHYFNDMSNDIINYIFNANDKF